MMLSIEDDRRTLLQPVTTTPMVFAESWMTRRGRDALFCLLMTVDEYKIFRNG